MAQEKIKFYDIENILSFNALYNVIFGERSNGKTYGSLKKGLERFFENGSEIAYIRRMEEDLRGGNASTLFTPLVNDGVITKLSKGKYNSIRYYNRRWYMEFISENKEECFVEDKPFAYAFALSQQEHYKSTSYPKVCTIIFDEFMTRQMYLPNEFVLFQNLLSTIIRQRDDVTIFMLGNTVNKFAPYFREMGLNRIDKMKKGDIDLYQLGTSGLTVAVEYADMPSKKKPSDKYFAFDNPHLKMITNGSWEIDIYPHLPVSCHYRPCDVLYKYYMKFNGTILQCNIIMVESQYITYIHRKTTEIKDDGISMVFQEEQDPRYNYRVNFLKATTPLEKKLQSFFARDKVFYQDNEVGEIVRNYLAFCKG